jgi:hypothetical protein
MSRTSLLSLRAALLVPAIAAGFLAAAPTAQAATPVVSVAPIPGVTVPYDGTTVIAPRIAGAGNVAIATKTLNVVHGTTKVAQNVTAARLKAGTYSVTSIARYRTWTLVNHLTTVPTQTLAFPANSTLGAFCTFSFITTYSATAAEFLATCVNKKFDGVANVSGSLASVDGGGSWTGSFLDGTPEFALADAPVAGGSFLARITANEDLWKAGTKQVVTTVRSYSALKQKSLTQRLVIASGPKPRGCAYYSEFQKIRYDFDKPEVYGSNMAEVTRILQSSGTRSSYSDYGDYVIEFRHYRGCAAGTTISVGFVDGYAYDKTYWG